MILLKKRCIIMFLAIPAIMAYSCNSFCYIFAASPSFSLQGIDNTHHNWYLEKGFLFGSQTAENLKECSVSGNFPFAHIAAVNYISGNKTLNATLWLTSPGFQEPTSFPLLIHSEDVTREQSIMSSSPTHKHNYFLELLSAIKTHTIREYVRKYAFIIHVDSVYDLGQTYQVAIDWNNTSHTWRRTATESVPFEAADDRVLEQQNNYKFTVVPGENYIDLSLNLGLLSYPSQYSIVAYALEVYKKDSVFCKLVDVTDVVHIPPPDVAIYTMPSSIGLLPAESRTVELQVKSNTDLQSNISLSTDENSNVKLSFEPNKLYVPSYGISSALVRVKALDNATANPYTLPIKANLSFPISVANWLTPDIFTNLGTKAIIREVNFTASVRPPLSLSEQLNSVWAAWGTPISGIVGLIAVILGGVGGWLLKNFKSRKSKEAARNNGDFNEGW
jgi:hypothetical protein